MITFNIYEYMDLYTNWNEITIQHCHQKGSQNLGSAWVPHSVEIVAVEMVQDSVAEMAQHFVQTTKLVVQTAAAVQTAALAVQTVC